MTNSTTIPSRVPQLRGPVARYYLENAWPIYVNMRALSAPRNLNVS